MSDFRAASGPTEVLATGTVIAFEGNPITIQVGPVTGPLKLVFQFTDEAGRDEPRQEGKSPDPTTLEVTLFNFKNPLGSGTIKPIPIGTLAGRQLYMHYRIYALGASDKMLHFTIFRERDGASSG